jgi:hypothetical protein
LYLPHNLDFAFFLASISSCLGVICEIGLRSQCLVKYRSKNKEKTLEKAERYIFGSSAQKCVDLDIPVPTGRTNKPSKALAGEMVNSNRHVTSPLPMSLDIQK